VSDVVCEAVSVTPLSRADPQEYFADYLAQYPSHFSLTPAALADGGDEPPNVSSSRCRRQYGRVELTPATAVPPTTHAGAALGIVDPSARDHGRTVESEEEASDQMGADVAGGTETGG